MGGAEQVAQAEQVHMEYKDNDGKLAVLTSTSRTTVAPDFPLTVSARQQKVTAV